MSVPYKMSLAGVVFAAIHRAAGFPISAARLATGASQRSCSPFFPSLSHLAAGLRKSVLSAPIPPPSPDLGAAACCLQGGKAALQCPESSASHSPDCALADWPAADAPRLARLLATLDVRPMGKKINLLGTAKLLGVSRKRLARDLHQLIYIRRLPVQRTKRCAYLAAPIPLCAHCAEIGRQFTQTEHFLSNFKAALPDVAGLAPIVCARTMGEREALLIHSPS